MKFTMKQNTRLLMVTPIGPLVVVVRQDGSNMLKDATSKLAVLPTQMTAKRRLEIGMTQGHFAKLLKLGMELI